MYKCILTKTNISQIDGFPNDPRLYLGEFGSFPNVFDHKAHVIVVIKVIVYSTLYLIIGVSTARACHDQARPAKFDLTYLGVVLKYKHIGVCV